MGYFPNGTAGEIYEAEHCAKCVHDDPESMCPILLAHNLYNYRDCNTPESILHLLIPRAEGGTNEKCRMFVARTARERDRRRTA